MSPDIAFFGRITIDGKRSTLGRSSYATILTRAAEQIRLARAKEESLIQIEISRGKFLDSTTFDKSALMEQELAQNSLTDPNDESPFPGITVGRVAEVMESPEYQAYEAICDPHKRNGLAASYVNSIILEYHETFPDCHPHFPKWIHS